MSPATYHPDISRQLMVPPVSIRVEVPGEALQELLRVLTLPAGLVLIEHDGTFCISTCPVQPHIALRLSFLARFLEHLQGGLIPVQHLPPEKLPVQLVIHRPQPVLAHPQQPVAHRLPAQLHSLPVPLLLLPVQRTAHGKFLYRDMRHSLRRGIAAGDNGGNLLRFHHRSLCPLVLASPAGVCIIPVLPDAHLGRDDFQRPAHFLAEL